MDETGRRPDRMLTYASGLAGGALALSAGLVTNAEALDGGSNVLRLMHRANYGFTPTDVASAERLGWSSYLESQLNHESLADPAMESMLAVFPTLQMDSKSIYSTFQETVSKELVGAKILRSVFSRRQLFERMVELWTDHFNINIQKGECQWLKTIDDRDVIRPHALGNFHDLLVATAKSPAMLTYLDNRTNSKHGPNENYARELLEIHTLGDASAFTQQDVKEVARCFTGWSVVGDPNSPDRGKFLYQSVWHDNGPKRVLGVDIPAGGGMQDGLAVLQILANHPATANAIAAKIGTFFYGPLPPRTFIRAISTAYSFSNGDIRQMLRVALSESWLPRANPMLKRPLQLFAGMLRAFQPKITSTSKVYAYLNNAGHLPFHWTAPDGFPNTFAYWSGHLTPRWDFGMALAANRIDGIDIPFSLLIKQNPTFSNVLLHINQRLFCGSMSAQLAENLQFFAGSQGVLTHRVVRDLFGLAASSPEYQFS